MQAKIGSSVEEVLDIFGRDVEINTYRPDLYATSYEFQKAGVKISVTILPDRASKIDVAYAKRPAEEIAVLLQRYSGIGGWRRASTGDAGFARHFPLFDPTRADYFVAEGVVAMIQKDVGFGELVLWIQTEQYPNLLQGYRSKQKKRSTQNTRDSQGCA